jgi:acyl transferase domain-containing protein
MMRTRRARNIAIIGMACRFPGAPDLASFWDNVVAGRDAIVDVPSDRWDPRVFCDSLSTANDRVPTCRGGYLDGPITFDPAAHGIMPVTIEGGEPEQFLVLDTARAALADAGLEQGVPAGRRAEVIVGRGNSFNRGDLTRLQHGRIVAQTVAILQGLHSEWTEADFKSVREDLKHSLPPFGPGAVAGQITNATAGRIADRLNLSGPSYVVDAASASSLVALDLGVRALVDRRADLAVVGGVYLACDVDFPKVFAQLGALSPSGRARPFDRRADGTVPGEGVGVVVLKRLPDAVKDGDRVYAVVRAIGIASDGRSRGLAAPSARGHARAMRRAYLAAGIVPRTVALIEGHGLGVPAADRAELRALRAVFGSRVGEGRSAICLGAVSSLIGHAMPAAGVAGLIKAALALHHRTLPPSPPSDEPYELLAPPLTLNRTARPWIHGGLDFPRRAAVNAFGFGGISAHAVLEEHTASADALTPGGQLHWESEAILLGADDRTEWLERGWALLDWLGRKPDVVLKDLAATLNAVAMTSRFRVGLVAVSLADLEDRLRFALERLSDPACRSLRDARGAYYWEEPLAREGGLAFLFPGEGSQYPGMLAELCRHFPEVRTLFDTADRVARGQRHERLPSTVLFGDEETSDRGLWSMESAINVVLSAQWALHQLLSGLDLAPDAVLGHSSGELLALAAADVVRVDRDLEDRLGELGTIFERLETSGTVPAATLVAVAADRARVEATCADLRGGLDVIIDNCPHQVVLAGTPESVELVVDRLRGQGVFCDPLPFARAYHSPAFAPALEPVRDFFGALELRRPRVPLYSCAIAGRMPDDAESIRRLAVDQWTRPVRFRETVETMYADGVRVFVEVGARGNLTGYVEDILRGRPAFAVAASLPRRPALTQLNHLVASLWAQGVSLRPDLLYARRRPKRLDLSVVPRAKPRPTLADEFPEMRLSDDLVRSLRFREARAVHSVNGPAGRPPEEQRDEAMLSFLRTMDMFLATQRDVMNPYLTSCKVGRPALREELPTVQEIRETGWQVVATHVLEIDGDPIAEHHTLGGRRISAIELDRKGLPVLPFTIMAEMLAQAAAAIVEPGRTLIALRDLHAHRWVRYEEAPVPIELRVRRDPHHPDEVDVVIVDRGTTVVEGRAVFACQRPAGPIAEPFVLEDAETCRFTAEELYRDQWLFHGPAMSALVHVGPASPHGIEGTLRVLPVDQLLRLEDPVEFKTDPIVLDSFTHLLGCWGLDRLCEGDVLFPLRLAELTFFGPDPPEGTDVSCRIRIRDIERHRVRADVEIVGPGDRLWMRIAGWEDWRFYWPSRYRDGFRAPDRVFLGEEMKLPGASSRQVGSMCAVWLEPPADMGRPIWRDVLEWVQLGPAERGEMIRRSESDLARTLDLWGRIAAKEAARRLWLAAGGTHIYPADLQVEEGPACLPRLRSLLDPGAEDVPSIAIACTDGVAVALAAHDPRATIGIAVARIGPEGEGVARRECARRAAASVGHDPAATHVATARRGDHVWAWTAGERTDP